LTFVLGIAVALGARVEVSDAADSSRPTTVGMFVVQTFLNDCDLSCPSPPGMYHLSVSLKPGFFTELVQLERQVNADGLSITNTAPLPAISDSGRWFAYGAPHRRIAAARISISAQVIESHPRTLLRMGRHDHVFGLAWDHKARYLVVQARLAGADGIWRVDRATGRRRLLAREHLTDYDTSYDTLSVSSTGRVAYMADAPSVGGIATAIYSTTLKGGHPHRITAPAHDGNDAMPTWSPDGRHLAYVHDAGTGEPGPQSGVLGLVKPPRDQRRRRNVVGASPAFSPDGKWLVSTRNTSDEVNALTMSDADLGHPKLLSVTGDIKGLGIYSSIVWLRTIS
jgi:hypothetical protein